jgi:hypothetical protein
MYARIKRVTNAQGKTYEYLQIVEAVREEGKVRQKVLLTVGRVDEIDQEKVDRLIESLGRFAKSLVVLRPTEDMETASSRVLGTPLVLRRLFEELRLPKLLESLRRSSRYGPYVPDAVFALVLNRLMDPMSKLSLHEWLPTVEDEKLRALELQHLYRALDFLAAHKERLEDRLFFTSRQLELFSPEVDLAFFDTTSSYFEGETAAEIVRYGFSKDSRPDRPQVVIGLLVTREGLPVAHWVFPGNTVDAKAFRQVVEESVARFRLSRVIFVGDRGMVSEETLEEMRRQGLRYIVGVKLRSKAGRLALSRPGRYRIVRENLRVKQTAIDGERYVICLNPEERERDRAVRQTVLETLEEKLKTPRALIGNSAYRRYLRLEAGAIDWRAVRLDEKLDGKYVIRTNTDLSAGEVALAYKGLSEVEQAFRTLKSELEIRPMYHWTERRIRGHIAACFLALVCRAQLKVRLRQVDETVPLTKALRELHQVRAHVLRLKDRHYLTRTPIEGGAALLFRAMGMQVPPRVRERA